MHSGIFVISFKYDVYFLDFNVRNMSSSANGEYMDD